MSSRKVHVKYENAYWSLSHEQWQTALRYHLRFGKFNLPPETRIKNRPRSGVKVLTIDNLTQYDLVPLLDQYSG